MENTGTIYTFCIFRELFIAIASDYVGSRRVSNLNQSKVAFFHVLAKQLFTTHTITRRSIILNNRDNVRMTYRNYSHFCKHSCSGKAVSIIFCVCISGLKHPARNSQAPYFHLLPAWLSNISSHYITKSIIKKSY